MSSQHSHNEFSTSMPFSRVVIPSAARDLTVEASVTPRISRDQSPYGRSLTFVRDDSRMNARITRGGFLTTVQDLGRPGFRQADRKSTRLNSSHVSESR